LAVKKTRLISMYAKSILLLLLLPSLMVAQSAAVTPIAVGLAKIDITPTYPIRLAGFGGRRTESEGVTQKIWAKALVIGQDQPVLLLALDACGVSHDYVEKLAQQLGEKIHLPRERIAVTVTHTHTAPLIEGYLTDTLFGLPIPPEHQAHIKQYSSELMTKLVQVAEQAWNNRQPSRLYWGIGTVGFAANRRTKGGPVDHDLPIMAIYSPEAKLRGVWINYACHCVTLSNNKISGDWAGFAADFIEKDQPGCMALVSIGCGADSDPDSGVTGDKVEITQKQGGFVATEVKRLLQNFLAPLPGKIICQYQTFTLPLGTEPTETQWQERAKKNDAVGYHARVQLERLAKGEKLPKEIPYSVQTWTFGDNLAMVFLSGEVVVDYALRLKKELDGQRLWVNAYSNHVPCYIPSERILKEGGYEGALAMTYYNLPAPLATGLEEEIIEEVKDQIAPPFRTIPPLTVRNARKRNREAGRFYPPYDPSKLAGSKPLSPQQSAATIKVRDALRVELMAAEPLVTSPVAIAFGPDGKLWVAEMYDYPKGLDGKFQPGGRIKVLESSRNDGHYDKATVFLDGIPFPTGITVWRKGVLVCAAPDILYAEDTDGDGKADVVKKLYSGFGTHNYQARVNSLEYGLDGWVYGSCGFYGGTITSFTGKKLELGNRDFRIKPDTGDIEPATGQTQQGRVRDDWDNWFGCDNSTLARHYVLADHYLRRNPQLIPPSPSVFVPQGPNANRFFPAKQQIQLFELSGPPGLPTAACGMGIYRDELMGNDLQGNLFTCEPVNLLVHRLTLSPQGSTFGGQRPSDEANSEFLAGTDNWFRPVQMRTGPDGCIWVVDMYRLVIEHPQWIPPADLAKLDVRAGSTMGRIYRVRPVAGEPKALRLSDLDTVGLIHALDSRNGTQRDLAMQMLIWKNDASCAFILEEQFKQARPEGRLHILSTLEALGNLSDSLLARALHDPHPGIRRQALRQAEKRLADSPALQQAVAIQINSSDSQLLLQFAYTLGAWKSPQAGQLLAQLLRHSGNDPYLTAAALSSLSAEHLESVLPLILDRSESLSDAQCRQLGSLAIALGNQEVLRPLLEEIKKTNVPRASAIAFLTGTLEALDRKKEKPNEALQATLRHVQPLARQLLEDQQTSESLRLSVIALMGNTGELITDQKGLLALLGPQQAPAIQEAVLAALARHNSDDVAKQLLAAWKQYTPRLRTRVLELLLSRANWQKQLLAAIENQSVIISQLDPSSKARLLSSRDQNVREKAKTVLAGSVNADRVKLIADYRPALASPGDRSRGQAVFVKNCSVCHRLEQVGHEVGPDLAALANKSKDYLLTEILDPNRNLDSRYVEYVAITKNGRTVTGVLAGESAGSVTLKGKEAREETLLRADLDELQATGKSLMPEGLEKEITHAEMNDLLTFLSKTSQKPKTFAGNVPATIKAVKEVVALHAVDAEIFGEAIAFEAPFQNIGMWQGLNDHVIWTVQVPKRGTYDVYLDWACDNGSAGNTLILEAPDVSLTHEVAGTGGWSHYLRVRIGRMKLEEGLQRIKVRPAGPALHGALLDLRTIYLAPQDYRLNLEDQTSREKPAEKRP
jgi:putative membrane-bound dehydrogenase-like protein